VAGAGAREFKVTVFIVASLTALVVASAFAVVVAFFGSFTLKK